MKESAKSSEETRPDMSSLQINLIMPCARVPACELPLPEAGMQKVMSTRASRRAYILHFSFVDCTSVRAGPLHKGQPRKLHAEIHTQHHTNIVLDLCTDELETRIIIHDVIHARTHAQTVSPSIRIRAHDSLRLQRVIPVRGGVGRAGAGAGGPGRTQWEPFSLAVPRGLAATLIDHAH